MFCKWISTDSPSPVLVICTVQTQTPSTKAASLPPLPALCICSLWSTPGLLKVNNHIGKHYKWPTTSDPSQKLFKGGVYYTNTKAIISCLLCLVYYNWLWVNMDLMFWRSIQMIQDILGFGHPYLQICPTRNLKNNNKKKQGIMTEKAISCSIQKWRTTKYS